MGQYGSFFDNNLFKNLHVYLKVYDNVLYYIVHTCMYSLFEEEISRMNPQAIVPPLPLQPTPTAGEYM